jgi:hypothetical protein
VAVAVAVAVALAMTVAVGSGSGWVAVVRGGAEWQCGHFGGKIMARVAVVVELW